MPVLPSKRKEQNETLAGPGIEPDSVPQTLERLSRSAGSRSGRQGGGFGLQIVRDLLSANDAQVLARSGLGGLK